MGPRVSVERDKSRRKLYFHEKYGFYIYRLVIVVHPYAIARITHSLAARLLNVRVDVLYFISVYYLLQYLDF